MEVRLILSALHKIQLRDAGGGAGIARPLIYIAAFANRSHSSSSARVTAPSLASLHWMDKMKKFRKASQLQSTTKSLDTLTVEMAAPVVTASAMREMHHFKRNRRKLQLIDSFHRYARSSCGCRFPESREPQGHTLSEARRLRKSPT